VVTLARFGLTTGFLLGPADDRRCRLVFSLRSRFSKWATCAVNIQGVLGEDTLGYKIMLIIYRVRPLGVCGWGLTGVVTLARFGLTTGFPAQSS